MEATALSIGTKVSYEDMANPPRSGYICDIEGAQFVIAWLDGTISYSDCRQRGWKVVR